MLGLNFDQMEFKAVIRVASNKTSEQTFDLQWTVMMGRSCGGGVGFCRVDLLSKHLQDGSSRGVDLNLNRWRLLLQVRRRLTEYFVRHWSGFLSPQSPNVCPHGSDADWGVDPSFRLGLQRISELNQPKVRRLQGGTIGPGSVWSRKDGG